MSSQTSPTRAGRREWIGLAVLALPCMLYSMDLTVLNLALPALSADLRPGPSQLLWIVDIYGFMVAGFLVTMGNLGDHWGRRRLLLAGALAFGLASILAAFSTSPEMLIAMRALLGVAGATLAPSTLSLIRNMFLDERERTLAISIWVTSYSVGAAIGPVVGGVLLEYFWWGSVFLAGVPVMLLLLVLGPRLLPEYRDPSAGRIDLASVVLSLAAVLPVVYGLKRLAEGDAGWHVVAAMTGGLLFALMFMRRQARLADPLIDPALFRIPAFATSVLILALACVVLFGVFVHIAQYLQLVAGLSPLAAGLWTVPWALAFVVGSLATPRLAGRFEPARLLVAGLLLAALGFGLMLGADAHSAPAVLMTGAVVLALGLSPTFTLATDMVVGAAPPERAGAAAAISETSSEFGGALGIALIGSLGTFIYQQTMGDAGLAGLDPARQEAARMSLSAALDVVHGLAEPQVREVLGAARDAFMAGLHLTALLGVATLALAAWLAARLVGSGTHGSGAGSGD